MPDLLSDYFSEMQGMIKKVDENILAFGREHNLKLTQIQEKLAASEKATNLPKTTTDQCMHSSH
jgi:hypothetical protein